MPRHTEPLSPLKLFAHERSILSTEV
jgi:hypothetical protein